VKLLVTGELAGGAGAFWIGFLIDLAVKGTLLLMAAHLLSMFLRNSRPAARSRVWIAFFVLLLMVPVAATILPSASPVRDNVERSWLGWEPVVTVVQVEQSASPAAGTSSGVTTSAATQRHESIASNVAPVGTARGSALTPPGISRVPWTALVMAWLAGFVVLLAWMLMRLGVSWLAVRRTRPFPADQAERLLRDVHEASGSCRRPELRLTADGAVPYLTGVLRPKLVLPAGATAWPPDRLRLVLLHELTHWRRRDLARLVLGDLVAAVFWFHPLAWSAIKKAAFEQELACDEEVCRRTARGIDYARLLVSFASGPQLRRQAIARPGLAGAAGLEQRMKHILSTSSPGDAGRSRRSRLLQWSSLLASASVFAVCLHVLAAALVKPVNELPPPSTPAAAAVTTAQIEKPTPSISIHEAAATGDRESVARLLEDDPRLLERPDKKGMTPLALAAWNMHLDLVEDLLAMGADPDSKNNNGLTPLFCAMDRDRPRLTRILLDAGADPATRGFRNWTLLHMAARNGDWETAQILIDAGLDVNARDTRGSTPLNYVHRYRTEDVGQVLLTAGAEEGTTLPPLPTYKNKKRPDA
jgi:beta-lactamase regulating signal transducer with metallopeptidase domain